MRNIANLASDNPNGSRLNTEQNQIDQKRRIRGQQLRIDKLQWSQNYRDNIKNTWKSLTVDLSKSKKPNTNDNRVSTLVCKYCSEKFSVKDSLKNHVRTLHRKDLPTGFTVIPQNPKLILKPLPHPHR
jgi:hypothetical protein